jgi:hypothetical protein
LELAAIVNKIDKGVKNAIIQKIYRFAMWIFNVTSMDTEL